MNGVNCLEDTIGVAAKDLGTAIVANHSGTTVSDFAGNIGGSIVGNIEGYAGPTLAGKHPAGRLLVAYQHLENFYQRW